MMRRRGQARWMDALRTRCTIASGFVLISMIGGCASSSNGPELLTISSRDYAAAFDAAVEAARRDGLPSVLRDRRGGVIETQPRMAGSALEPWRTDNASFAQSLENTVVFQRRRARFEFAPVGFNPPDDVAAHAPLTGPDMVNAEDLPLDLTTASGDLELRVWVYLERATVPGQRRSTWTRSKTSQTILTYPEGMADRRNVQMTWTPIARDADYERRLLAAVQEILAASELTTQPATEPGAEISSPLALSGEPLRDGTE